MDLYETLPFWKGDFHFGMERLTMLGIYFHQFLKDYLLQFGALFLLLPYGPFLAVDENEIGKLWDKK